MESLVIGTAGHIDHGKSALVQALTGQNPDTILEEKKRGITIDLGFAYFTLPSGKTAGLVDVPGHERFVRNMVAGATGMDMALVVISATDGVMPQTREHVDILSYLPIQKSIVVLTKTDLVDSELLELVRQDTREYLDETFLKEAPFLEVDSLSGKGIPALIEEIDRLAGQLVQRPRSGRSRLTVDRSFSVKGFGTVVTGTLTEGEVSVGDDVVVYPEETPVKVRSVQVHGRSVERSEAGQRTALNLSGVERKDVPRGTVVAQRESVAVTTVLDVYFSLLPTAPPIKRMESVRVHLGAREHIGRLVPFETSKVLPGEEGYGQILLDTPAVARKGDPFILRGITPVATLGGGRVLDPYAQRVGRASPAYVEGTKIKDSGGVEEILQQFIYDYPFSTQIQLEQRANQVDRRDTLTQLMKTKKVVRLDGYYLHAAHAQDFLEHVVSLVGAYHQAHPLREGMTVAQLESAQQRLESTAYFTRLLAWVEEQGAVINHGGRLSLPDFQVVYSPEQQRLKEGFLQQLEDAGFELLTLGELYTDDGEGNQVLEALMQKDLLLLEGEYLLTLGLYQQAKEILTTLYTQRGSIELAEFRDAIGSTRRYALMLLEQFDRQGITKRQGDKRLLL